MEFAERTLVLGGTGNGGLRSLVHWPVSSHSGGSSHRPQAKGGVEEGADNPENTASIKTTPTSGHDTKSKF